MGSVRLAMAGGAAAACLAGGSAAAAPPAAYGALPSVSHVTISPDGSKVAYVVLDHDKQAVVIAGLDPLKAITGQGPTDRKIRGLAWADSDHLMVMKSRTGYADGVWSDRGEWSMVQVLDLAHHKVTPLLDAEAERLTDHKTIAERSVIMNAIDGEPQSRSVDGRPVVYVKGVAFVDDRGASALFAVDLAKGVQTRVETAPNADDGRSWLVDSRGALLAQVNYNVVSKIWTLRLRRGNAWAEAYSTHADLDAPSVEGLTADGGSLIVRLPAKNGAEFKALPLAGGPPAAAPGGFDDIDDVIEDPATHRIIGGVQLGMEAKYTFFDRADQATWDGIEQLFPGEEVELASWSDDRKKIIVEVTGQTHGVAYVLVDLKAHKATVIADAYEGLKPDDVAGVETIAYKAADGLTIPAFLTLPNGRDPKKLPLVVLPHGGPGAKDGPGFDWWAQALAARGYAVLQPQFRGSEGLGWDLQAAGFGEWGRKMQTDLSDGVAALARSGIIDPKRVCIVGGSYGGYAALAGVTMQSGIYRCAVSVAGVSDLHKQLGGWSANANEEYGVRYMDRYMGAKDPTDPALDKISPVRFAAKLSAPLLMIHGLDDTVVQYDQSRKMGEALKAAGKTFEFVTLKSEDHWLSRTETRQQMLEATVKFVEANNPPG